MANLIPSPRFWKNKAILFKGETPYGTDAVPTGADNWIEARNVKFQPFDVESADKNVELPFMGNAGKVLIAKWAKLSFDVLAAGSGAAGTAPKWAPLLMACGFAETITASVSAAYNLISTGFTSGSCYINIDGVYHKLLGGRGNCKFKMGAKGVPLLTFEFDFPFVTPVTAAMPSVTRTGWQLDEGVNDVNTTALSLNGVSLAFSDLSGDVGNKIARIDLPGPQVEVVIQDRDSSMDVMVVAPALAGFDPFALATAGTNVALSVTHGSAAGRKLKVDGKVILSGVDYAEIEGMPAYKLTLEPTPVSGNDELALTCL